MRILRQIAIGTAIEIGEIATPAAGDADFFRDFLAMVQDQNAAAALARLDGAHQSGRAGPQNQDIGFHGTTVHENRQRLKAGLKHPVWAHPMTGIAAGIFLQIILVITFRFIKFGGRQHLRHHFARPFA